MDAAQRYKSEADQLAATFYGPSATSTTPPRDPAASPRDPTSLREANSSARDPASSRRFVGVQSPASPPPSDDAAAVSETSIREGAASMILRLGLSSPRPDDIEDSLSIRQAERDLQETVSKTGGADVIGFSVPSSSNDLTGQSSAYHVDSRHSTSSRQQMFSTTTTPQDASADDGWSFIRGGADSEEIRRSTAFSQRQVGADKTQTLSPSSSSSFISGGRADRADRNSSVSKNSAVHDQPRRQKPSPSTSRSQYHVYGGTLG